MERQLAIAQLLLTAGVVVVLMVGQCDSASQGSRPPLNCDQSYLGRLETGSIQSYNFPFDYRHNLTCRYRIYLDHQPTDASTTNTICFTFHHFDLEASSPYCSFDYVQFNGQFKYCGRGKWSRGDLDVVKASVWNRNFCWTTQASYFEIILATDNNVNEGGFYATYKVHTRQPISGTTDTGSPSNACITRPSCVNTCLRGYQTDVNGCPTCKCLPREAPCSDGEYTCFNRKCILANQTCDGVNDCGDWSDESYAYARCIEAKPMTCMFTNESMCSIWARGWLKVNALPTHAKYGPKSDHTVGQANGGYFVYTPFSSSTADEIAHLYLPEMTLNHTHCLTFWYYMYGPQTGKLYAYVDGEQMFRSPTWSRVGSQADRWLIGQVEINGTGSVKVVFEGANKNHQNIIALDDISVLPGECNGDDISCNFETGMCGWMPSLSVQNYHGNADWVRNKSGVTLGRPPKDHSSLYGDGWYLFLQAPSPRPSGYRALIISPPVSSVSLQDVKCLSFWYYTSGNSSSSARISVLMFHSSGLLGENVLTLSDKPRHVWLHATAELVFDKPYQIVMEGVINGNHVGALAVDQIVFRDGRCTFPDWPGHPPQTVSPEPAGCKGGQFPCNNGRCVRPDLVCDGVNDCADNSDEDRCARPTSTAAGGQTTPYRNNVLVCGVNEYLCSDGSSCIPRSRWCDGQTDCQDSSDEGRRGGCKSESTPSTVVCARDMFTCQNRKLCLSRSKFCDGRNDCSDGSDEDYRFAGCQVLQKQNFWTTGAIVGVVFGCAGLIAIVCITCLIFRIRKRQPRYHHSRNPVVAFINSNMQPGQVMSDIGEPPPYLVHINRDFGFILDRSLTRQGHEGLDPNLPPEEAPPPYDAVLKEDRRNAVSSAAAGAGQGVSGVQHSHQGELGERRATPRNQTPCSQRGNAGRHPTGEANFSNISADSSCPILTASADVYREDDLPVDTARPAMTTSASDGNFATSEVYAPMSTGSAHSCSSIPLDERSPADRSPYALYDADARERELLDSPSHEYAEIPANFLPPTTRTYQRAPYQEPPAVPDTPRPVLGLSGAAGRRPNRPLSAGSIRYTTAGGAGYLQPQPSTPRSGRLEGYNPGAEPRYQQQDLQRADVRYHPDESYS